MPVGQDLCGWQSRETVRSVTPYSCMRYSQVEVDHANQRAITDFLTLRNIELFESCKDIIVWAAFRSLGVLLNTQPNVLLASSRSLRPSPEQ